MKRGALILLLAGCELEAQTTCEELADELRRCDLPPMHTACELLDERGRRWARDRLRDTQCDAESGEGPGDIELSICDALGWPCPAPLFPMPAPLATRGPIVFVSGIDDHPVFAWHPRILEAVRELGIEAQSVILPPWSTPEHRAAALGDALAGLAIGRNVRFNLICYAVAGIDCRALVSPGGIHASDPTALAQAQSLVASITTIATPHRGTRVASAALDLSTHDAITLLDAIRGGELVADERRPDDTALEIALGRLTPESMGPFNDRVIDPPGIPIFSWAGVSHVLGQPFVPAEGDVARDCRGEDGQLLLGRSGETYDVMSELLWITAPFAGQSDEGDTSGLVRPGDGMVAVASARWGTFRGCIPADHYDVIGQIDDRGLDPNSGFDARAFYANVAVDLARRGL